MYFLFQDFCDTPSGHFYNIVNIIGIVVAVFQIVIPILLIILAMVDLSKLIIINKDDDMKKIQSRLIKRIIYAASIFFVLTGVKLVINLLNIDVTTDTGHAIDSCLKLVAEPDYSVIK